MTLPGDGKQRYNVVELMTKTPAETRILISGNEAAAEAAIRAGCRFYAGYPITPQNELIAYMADQLPLRGGVFVQAESELAAISMLHGASAAGMRCMTSSSSPGISLKQEGISYLAGSELPAVIINVCRAGPGLGQISPSQSDYFQSTRGGGHGDYRTIVLAPATVQEMADFTYEAFDLADKYRNPVLVLADGMVGQTMEGVGFDHLPEPHPPAKPWALTGAAGRPRNLVKSLCGVLADVVKFNEKLMHKYEQIAQELHRCETVDCEGAEVLIAAYGTSARMAHQVVKDPPGALRGKLGMVRPMILWPFPYEEFASRAGRLRGILTVEMNAGQMIEDVRLGVEGRCPVHLLPRPGGAVPTAGEIADKLVALFT